MATIRYSLTACLITIIKFYRFTISTLLGACCRFEPSCSHYAMEAIKMYGCFKGCGLSLWRILRCHPWHPGGMDPVPTNQDAKR
jgi:putative membrane protein insertion efficiency factor